MKLRQILAKNVRARRKALKLSVEKLANQADVSRSFMFEVERARYSTRLDVVERIAKVLKVEPWQLLRPDE